MSQDLEQTEVSSSVDSLFSLCVSTDIELQFYVEMRMKRFPPAPERVNEYDS